MIANDKIHAIFRRLVEDIVSGKYTVGQHLPTDKELAGEFATSRINVFRALEQLKRLGLISSNKRAGTVVAAAPDAVLSQQLLNDSSRIVYCLRSEAPNFVHWNEETLLSLTRRLEKASLRLQQLTLSNCREEFAQIIANSIRFGAAGLIILPDSKDSSFLNQNSDLLVDVSTPIVMFNRGNDISPLDFVNSVNVDILGDAIRMGVLLRKNGFKRMLVPGNDFHANNKWPRTRIAGLLLGFRGEGVSRPVIIDDLESGIDFSLDRAAVDPELVISTIHPTYARRILERARERGMTPGKDLNLICFDDNPAFEDCQLTTTSVRKADLGDIIGKLLLDNLRHTEKYVWNSIRIASEIIQRTSCRPLAL